MDRDPTEINLRTDPLTRTMEGVTNHKHLHFVAPYMSHIADNLWNGGCEYGLVLPENIDYVLSLYPWGKYTVNHPIKEHREVKMYDALGEVDREQVLELARWVNEARKDGEVLVHCQAGLNRSGMIVAVALMLDGMSAQEAIDTLRKKRSEASLCNQDFEDFLLDLDLEDERE